MNLPFFSGFWSVFRNVSRQMAAVLTQYELMEIAALKVALGDAAWLQEVVMRMPEVVKDMELAMNQWPGRRFGTLGMSWKNPTVTHSIIFQRGRYTTNQYIYIYGCKSK